MTISFEQSVQRMEHLGEAVLAATVEKMRAAAYVIARQTKDEHPDALRVHLFASDQGDWLDVARWDNGTRTEDLEPADESACAATFLYTPHIGNAQHAGAVPGLRCIDRRGGDYVLEVDQVLAECAQSAVIAEMIIARDPDGPVDIDVAVFGAIVDEQQVRVFTVDAGAGWMWSEWVLHRDVCLSRASDGLQGPLRATFSDPPGGEYVEGRDGQNWIG